MRILDKWYFNELPRYLIMPLPEIAKDKKQTRMYFFLFEKVCYAETAAERR